MHYAAAHSLPSTARLRPILELLSKKPYMNHQTIKLFFGKTQLIYNLEQFSKGCTVGPSLIMGGEGKGKDNRRRKRWDGKGKRREGIARDSKRGPID
jgi:hypothetical protein